MNYLQQLNKARANSKKATKEARKSSLASLGLRFSSFLEQHYLSRTTANVVKAKESKAKSKEFRTQLDDLLKDLD